MMARVIAVERLILVKKIAFSDKAAVDVAILQVNICLSFMLDMSDFLSSPLAQGPVEDQKLAMAEDHAAALKGRMSLWLAVQCSCHLGSTLACSYIYSINVLTVIARQQDTPHMLNSFGEATDLVTSHFDPN